MPLHVICHSRLKGLLDNVKGEHEIERRVIIFEDYKGRSKLE